MDRKINRIKTALVDKGKTNKWLAEQLGKDPATVSKWCTNAAQPSLETLMQIARLIEVQTDDLLRLEKVSVQYRGLRIVYTYDENFHEDYVVSDELQILYV